MADPVCVYMQPNGPVARSFSCFLLYIFIATWHCCAQPFLLIYYMYLQPHALSRVAFSAYLLYVFIATCTVARSLFCLFIICIYSDMALLFDLFLTCVYIQPNGTDIQSFYAHTGNCWYTSASLYLLILLTKTILQSHEHMVSESAAE